ncbi:MAG: hypothetical protein ACK5CW_06320 [Verrucomicrobiota bacterium]|jgi:hypothetical protein
MNLRPAAMAAVLAALLFPSCQTPPAAAPAPASGEAAAVAPIPQGSLNDAARFLAGMPGPAGSPLAAARQTTHWNSHSRRMDELWRYFANYRQPAIGSFCRSELGWLRDVDTVWYPFSGPDILFADAFFPRASSFLLTGLEGCEMLPDLGTLSPEEIAAGLDGIETSITTVLSCSFFITKDMKTDLQRTRFRGTLPIILVFMARLGYSIDSVQPAAIDAASVLTVGNATGNCPGYIVRARAGGRTKTVYYFSANLADYALRSDPRYLLFVSRFGGLVTYLKSASYLMHTSEFTMVRDAILRQSGGVLQDDSGIPISAFGEGAWEMRCYGRYTGVLDLFAEHYQPNLAEIYRSGGARDIDFGIGYKHRKGESSLILARRR